MHSLPVAWKSRDGHRRIEGVLGFENGSLRLQYQSLEWHQGAPHKVAREVTVDATAIVSCAYGSGLLWIAPWLEINVSDYEALARLDADPSGTLRFRLAARHGKAARALVEELESARAEVRYARWNQHLDRIAPGSAPPDSTAPPGGET